MRTFLSLSKLTRPWQLVVVLLSSLLPIPTSTLLIPQTAFFRHAAANPLTQLTLNLEELSQQFKLSDSASHELIVQSLASLDHLKALILPGSHVSRSFKVKASLHEVVTRNHAPTHHKFLMSIINIPAAFELQGNALFFQEALECVIHNAFEAYSPQEETQIVHVLAKLANRQLVISITDYGRGMTWLTRTFVGKSHYTHKTNTEIHGQGMSFVKQVVEREFYGQVLLSSQPHLGTIVSLRFPSTF